VRVRRAARDLGLDAGWFTWPDPVSVPTTSGKRTHALVYPPANPDMGVWDGPTPLMVLIHGGPTAAARPLLSMAVRYWTSRGWTVADVNYRGSTGYGRRYRDQLHEGWGVVDVADCVAVAQWLADAGRVDADRMVIRGGSAGGFTTLAALCDSDVFAAGTSLYGIADLELLTAETHRFESGYNDWLVGALPEHADRYVDRSPIHHIDRLDRPLLVLHGAQDAVVPPSQAELVVGALRSAGVPVGYLLFDGEQHGFRRAETLERALVAEAYFLASVLDLPGGHESPPGYGGPWPPVDIENLSGH
jgi:dipeptidyl aminopeptidase/acylaminoacyl peptidase